MTEDSAARIGALAGVAVAGVREVGTRHGFRHLTGTLADGRGVFVKAAVGGGVGAPWPGYIASLPLDNTPLVSNPPDNAPPDPAPLGNHPLDRAPLGNAGAA